MKDLPRQMRVTTEKWIRLLKWSMFANHLRTVFGPGEEFMRYGSNHQNSPRQNCGMNSSWVLEANRHSPTKHALIVPQNDPNAALLQVPTPIRHFGRAGSYRIAWTP